MAFTVFFKTILRLRHFQVAFPTGTLQLQICESAPKLRLGISGRIEVLDMKDPFNLN